MHLKKLLMALVATIAAGSLLANNIQVANISVQNRDVTLKTSEIHFDLSWENSWKTTTLESNWDAAWVFIKFRIKGHSEWKHATLKNTGHTSPSASALDLVSDQKGVFVKSSAAMMPSNVNYQDIGLKWNYGLDGVHDDDSAEICIFAIEMVYVPQGAFYAGDGNGTSYGSFTSLGSAANDPYYITSENAISDLAGKDAIGDIPLSTASTSPTIPADFPKGYQGFYCMKYEITQGQYAAFLNKLSATEISTHAFTSGLRNTVSGSWPTFSASAPHRAYAYINSRSACAYADWAGLRPMSELEYEKACRGPIFPRTNEFAWGDTTVIDEAGVINDGLANETATNAANANIGTSTGTFGPLRTGWAGSMPASRANTGSSYYGIANMTGNVSEIVVKVSSSGARVFNSAAHGDGYLSSIGDPDVVNWPATYELTTRGGGWNSDATDCHVSSHDITNNFQSGYWENGFRCARTY